MKIARIAAIAAAAALSLVFAAMLAACGGGSSSFDMQTLEEANGVKVTAENAVDDSAKSSGALTVEGDGVIVISPDAKQGGFHVTITSQDGKVTAYDGDADGRVMFSVPAQPGTYDVEITAKNATGAITVFTMSAAEMAAQDAELAEVLEKNGVDPNEVLPQ